MKKFTGNIAVKILAVVMSFIVFLTMIISVLGVAIMLYNDFYTKDFDIIETDIMQSLAESEISNTISKYGYNPSNLQHYYNDKNFYYEIQNLYDNSVISNYDGQAYIAFESRASYIECYFSENGDMYYEYAVYSEYDGYDNTSYYNYDGESLTPVTQQIQCTIYIPQKMQYTDRVFICEKLITFGFDNRYTLIFLGIASLILGIIVYSYLFISVGHTNYKKGISVCAVNNIPADIFTVLIGIAICFSAFLIRGFYDSVVSAIVVTAFVLTFMYFLLLWYALSIAVQLKTKILFKHTLIYLILKIIAKLGGIIKHIYKNLKTVYKTALAIVALGVFELIFMWSNAYESDNLIICWIIVSVIVSVILLLAAIAFQKVKIGGEKIVDGDLDSKIDTEYMYGDIKDFAESLNNINNGLQVALNDKMKSERFKTELITNVSHDIKTPLTSIVNYVDLIKKEDCENQKIKEYIEVLDRQSNRLKKLIEDLIEASKASTGNLTVELAKCNVSVLVNQAVGEFTERLETKNLQVVQSVENQELYILADGRRLWRVFDNILNNVCKYAMPGTRIYIDLKKVNSKAVINFRNISELPITVSGEDLTERFVRGDRSRNTEGSGLGLSIAKSLTELQNGSFKVETDGDLFKTIITFDILEG